MRSLADGFQALVIGSSGAIGAALVEQLELVPGCSRVIGLHRHSVPDIDFLRPQSVELALRWLVTQGPFDIIINAAGVLHTERYVPEKKLADLNFAQMTETFAVNTFGPALLLGQCAALLSRQRALLAVLSAKVGSIGDNRLGGWYSYRASKAALNMMLKTAAIELRRTRPQAVLVALHPGTVDTPLSEPFGGAQRGRPAKEAARDLLTVLDGLQASDSGGFFSYTGSPLPW